MEKVKAKIIIEIMGRPPEHVTSALKEIVSKIGSEKGVSVIGKKFNRPKAIKEAQNLFIAFTEIDVEFESIDHFFAVIVSYMPSHVEVYEPENIRMNSSGVNALANQIVSKLHRYDEVVKRAIAERDVLARELNYLKSGAVNVPNPPTPSPVKPSKKTSKKKK